MIFIDSTVANTCSDVIASPSSNQTTCIAQRRYRTGTVQQIDLRV